MFSFHQAIPFVFWGRLWHTPFYVFSSELPDTLQSNSVHFCTVSSTWASDQEFQMILYYNSNRNDSRYSTCHPWLPYNMPNGPYLHRECQNCYVDSGKCLVQSYDETIIAPESKDGLHGAVRVEPFHQWSMYALDMDSDGDWFHWHRTDSDSKEPLCLGYWCTLLGHSNEFCSPHTHNIDIQDRFSEPWKSMHRRIFVRCQYMQSSLRYTDVVQIQKQ